MAPNPLFNTTLVCNTSEACASALDKAQEYVEDAQHLTSILAALLGIVFLLFMCSPVLLNLPKEADDDFGVRGRGLPTITKETEIELRDFEIPQEMPRPEQFVIGDEEPESPRTTESSLPDPSRYREVTVDGERFHVTNSDISLQNSTGAFREAGDETSGEIPPPIGTAV